MSFAVQRATSSAAAATPADLPTSAVVLDFICLFTHDLKRKQKRWQDGKLKYHTFNKRIMVYDDRGSFIGDAHWQADHDLGQGEELQLDRGSAIVQVSDCVGSREQDLTEILDKRAKEVEKRRANAVARTPVSTGRANIQARPESSRSRLQPQWQPPTAIAQGAGVIGRATIPGHSPYEARLAERDTEKATERMPQVKRRKLSVSPPSKAGHARSLFGATLNLSASSASLPTPRSSMRPDKMNVQPDSGVSSASNGQQKEQAGYHLEWTKPGGPSLTKTSSTLAVSRSTADTAATLEQISSAQLLHQAIRAKRAVPEDDAVPTNEASETGQRLGRTPCVTPNPSALTSRGQPVIILASPEMSPSRAAPAARFATNHDSRHSGKAKNSIECAPAGDVSLRGAAKRSEARAENGHLPEDVAPRTKLRIKSRQKRGLLMVSEKKSRQQTKATRTREPVSFESSARRKRDQDLEDETPHRSIGRRHRPDTANESESSANASGSEIDSPPLKLRVDTPTGVINPRHDRSLELHHASSRKVSMCTQSHDESTSTSPPSKTRAKKAREVLENACKRQVDESAVAQGPRITRMARKSVKSREIIGFTPPRDNSIVPPLEAKALPPDIGFIEPRLADTPDTGANGALETTFDLAQQSLSITQASGIPLEAQQKQSTRIIQQLDGEERPMLVNPATRGKKAAKKEDAAGDAPQMVVPLEPLGTKRTSTATVGLGNLPGFRAANGGAWSEHAEDLLGMTRPAAKA